MHEAHTDTTLEMPFEAISSEIVNDMEFHTHEEGHVHECTVTCEHHHADIYIDEPIPHHADHHTHAEDSEQPIGEHHDPDHNFTHVHDTACGHVHHSTAHEHVDNHVHTEHCGHLPYNEVAIHIDEDEPTAMTHDEQPNRAEFSADEDLLPSQVPTEQVFAEARILTQESTLQTIDATGPPIKPISQEIPQPDNQEPSHKEVGVTAGETPRQQKTPMPESSITNHGESVVTALQPLIPAINPRKHQLPLLQEVPLDQAATNFVREPLETLDQVEEMVLPAIGVPFMEPLNTSVDSIEDYTSIIIEPSADNLTKTETISPIVIPELFDGQATAEMPLVEPEALLVEMADPLMTESNTTQTSVEHDYPELPTPLPMEIMVELKAATNENDTEQTIESLGPQYYHEIALRTYPFLPLAEQEKLLSTLQNNPPSLPVMFERLLEQSQAGLFQEQFLSSPIQPIATDTGALLGRFVLRAINALHTGRPVLT